MNKTKIKIRIFFYKKGFIKCNKYFKTFVSCLKKLIEKIESYLGPAMNVAGVVIYFLLLGASWGRLMKFLAGCHENPEL